MNEQSERTAGWPLERSGPAAYERYLVTPLFVPWAERLIDRVELRRDDRVLGVGCGTGIVARRAAARVGDEGAVVGLDVNEAMLAVATATAAEDGLAVEWRRGDATELPFSADAFDVVFSQQALQFVQDPVAALREIHRVVTPGGRVAVSVWRPLRYNPGYVELADALEEYVGEEAGR